MLMYLRPFGSYARHEMSGPPPLDPAVSVSLIFVYWSRLIIDRSLRPPSIFRVYVYIQFCFKEKLYHCMSSTVVFILNLNLKYSETQNPLWPSGMIKSPGRAAGRSHIAMSIISVTLPHPSLAWPYHGDNYLWSGKPRLVLLCSETHTKLDDSRNVSRPPANDKAGDITYEAQQQCLMESLVWMMWGITVWFTVIWEPWRASAFVWSQEACTSICPGHHFSCEASLRSCERSFGCENMILFHSSHVRLLSDINGSLCWDPSYVYEVLPQSFM